MVAAGDIFQEVVHQPGGDQAGAVERAHESQPGAAAHSAPAGSPSASKISLPIDHRMTEGWLRSRLTMASVSRCHHS